MAEAHQAVAFSLQVTHDGWNVNFDREVLHLIWSSGLRSWKKRYARLLNNIHCGIYPGTLSNLGLSIVALGSAYAAGWDASLGLIPLLRPHTSNDLSGQIVACTVAGVTLWTSTIFAVRYLLKTLFIYKGWMYEERGKNRKISLKTKIWVGLVHILSGWRKPMLYSFQGSLPHLPLPSVHDTMQRYLRSVRPLMEDSQYERMSNLAHEFENGIGKKLQRYLILKRWWSTNYVTDWWEDFVYLKSRSPIMVNSNFYGLDAIKVHPTRIQAARAAHVAYGCLLFRRSIDRQELEPIMVQGMVPLCSWQYERVFNTCRIPGIEVDRIQHEIDSTHIVVYHKGRYWKLPIHHKGVLLKPPELQIQFQRILDDQSEPCKGEEQLAALTASERETWANARATFFATGTNRVSLDLIEKAAFVVVLDEEEYGYDPNDESKLNHFAASMLHGKGYDRWFDKSFNIVVGKNGKVGFNAEHSWSDAAIIGHLWEHMFHHDLIQKGLCGFGGGLCAILRGFLIEADAPILGHMIETSLRLELDGYDENGNTLGVCEVFPLAPSRLKWDISEEAQEVITKAAEASRTLLEDVDLKLLMYESYGKGFMKICRVSPDAYIQMALQLAYFRDFGKFSLTYEASMTRLFREGRTETVRPCTIESTQWVKSMEDPNCSDEERRRLFRVATARHQLGYQDAMCGKGIDRHLFCLYVVSKYLEVDSPFLKEVLSEPWRLSTSQTPHGQTTQFDLSAHPQCISAGGGFGPVADDGYGVSYIVAGEDVVFFHVSSKKSSGVTDSTRFVGNIRRSLNDIHALMKTKSPNGVQC